MTSRAMEDLAVGLTLQIMAQDNNPLDDLDILTKDAQDLYERMFTGLIRATARARFVSTGQTPSSAESVPAPSGDNHE